MKGETPFTPLPSPCKLSRPPRSGPTRTRRLSLATREHTLVARNPAPEARHRLARPVRAGKRTQKQGRAPEGRHATPTPPPIFWGIHEGIRRSTQFDFNRGQKSRFR